MQQLLFATYLGFSQITTRETRTMSDESNQTIAAENPPAPPETHIAPLALKLFRLGFRLGGHLSPGLTGRIAYKLWFTPTRFKTPEREKAVLQSARINTLQINHHRITTYAWGSGPIVLLAHGWSGRGTQLGSFVSPLVDAGYRVVSFDAPAHGRSSGKQTNLYEVADVILALQRHYGAFDAVISHSFGGPCISIAVQRGLDTKRIVSISPPATTLGLVEKFNSTLHLPEKAGANLIQRIENTFGKTVWHDISMINTAKNLTMPGLLIHDTHDEDIPWQEGHAVSQSWENARFIKTSNLGHRRILRDASVIESAVSFIGETNG